MKKNEEKICWKNIWIALALQLSDSNQALVIGHFWPKPILTPGPWGLPRTSKTWGIPWIFCSLFKELLYCIVFTIQRTIVLYCVRYSENYCIVFCSVIKELGSKCTKRWWNNEHETNYKHRIFVFNNFETFITQTQSTKTDFSSEMFDCSKPTEWPAPRSCPLLDSISNCFFRLAMALLDIQVNHVSK